MAGSKFFSIHLLLSKISEQFAEKGLRRSEEEGQEEPEGGREEEEQEVCREVLLERGFLQREMALFFRHLVERQAMGGVGEQVGVIALRHDPIWVAVWGGC